MTTLHAVAVIVAILLFAVGLPIFGAAVVGIIRNLAKFSVHISSFSDAPIWIKYNPANALFAPQYLDGEGLKARSRVLYWVRALVIAFVMLVAASALSESV